MSDDKRDEIIIIDFLSEVCSVVMFPIAQCAAWVGSKVATRKHSQKKTALKGEPNARMPECRMPNALVAIVQCAAMVDGLQRRSCIPAGSSKTPQIVSATNTACNSYSNVTHLD